MALPPSASNGHKADFRHRNLDVNDAAVLFIDHQVGTLLFGITDVDAVNLHNSALELAEVAKLLDVPAVLTTSNPTAINGPLFADLTELLPDAPIINRTAINAWRDEAFVAAVKATGRTQLIMAGVTVDVCLTLPAISAAGDGYDVYGVTDASGSTNLHGLYAAMFRMDQAGVKVASTNMVVAELLGDWSVPQAMDVGGVFARRQPNSGYLAQFMQTVAAAVPA
jgi:nicotinamidase-related amidase